MAKQLNASCSFQNSLLVCELTADAVEVVLKLKMRWGKHTLIKDQYNRTEKFCPWKRADRRVKICARRKRMPRCMQDINSKDNDTKGDSVESMDSETCIPTGKGYSYPLLIFTDPDHAANMPGSDIDSVTERPQLSSYVGDYCGDCVIKWSRCICKPESDLDDDQNYTVRSQTDSPSNMENNRHPIPLDWSHQEDFWNGKAYEKLPSTQHKYQDISDKNDSDWNDNLYPPSYGAKSQPQVPPPPRQPPPGWPKEVRPQSLPSPTSNTENDTNTNLTIPSERKPATMITQRRKRPHIGLKM